MLKIEDDELDQNGMTSDLEVIELLNVATLHPNLQII